MVEIQGLDELKARMKTEAEALRSQVEKAINTGADEFVALAKAACPVGVLEHTPGELRASIHKEKAKTTFGQIVVADAKDERGREYGAHVEFGHRTPDGKHVAPQPFFYTSWRVVRRRVKSRITRAVNQAVKGISGG